MSQSSNPFPQQPQSAPPAANYPPPAAPFQTNYPPPAAGFPQQAQQQGFPPQQGFQQHGFPQQGYPPPAHYPPPVGYPQPQVFPPQPFPQQTFPPPQPTFPQAPALPVPAPAPDIAGGYDPVTGQPIGFDPVTGLPLAPAETPVLDDAKPVTPFQRFWRRFGGEGFIISAGLHAVIIILALIWIVQRFVISPDPEKFTTGAGGGNNGATVSMNEHRIKPKHARQQVRSPNKLLVKGAATSVSLPEMPSMNMAALADGNPLGAASKGLGGGAGGGEGGGIGVGRGGGRNMVSLFGTRGFDVPGLTGKFYDIKQTRNGALRDPGIPGYVAVCNRFVSSGWSESVLEKYYVSPEKLSLQQFIIPVRQGNAGEAPAAFQAKGVKASRWIVHYKGSVTAPFTGKFRFVGMADDWLTVRWSGKLGLVSGYNLIGTYPGKNPPKGVGDRYPYGFGRPAFFTGPWIEVREGESYPMEIAIGETPGGEFCGVLAWQKSNSNSPLYLFRMAKGELPKEATDGSKGNIPSNVQLDGGGVIWTPKMNTGFRGRR